MLSPKKMPELSERYQSFSPKLSLVLRDAEGSCEGGQSLVEARDRDKKGSRSFFLTPRSPSVHPRAILSLSPGLLRSKELGVIQIRLIPVIFQSFIRRRRAAGGVGGGERSPRG